MAERVKRSFNKKEIVKNCIIIFLVVMLGLTFFSNTIMNYSLPEVSAQYSTSGTISNKIRGNGFVEAGQAYQVNIDETRVIAGIHVQIGETVSKGQTLFSLEDSESEELKSAIKELERMETELETTLLSLDLPTYASQNLAIKRAQEDLQEALALAGSISNPTQAVKDANDRIRAINDSINGTTGELAEAEAGTHPGLQTYKTRLDSANAALRTVEANYNKYNDIIENSPSVFGLISQINKDQDILDDAKNNLSTESMGYSQAQFTSYMTKLAAMESDWNKFLLALDGGTSYDSAKNAYTTARTAESTAYAAYANAISSSPSAQDLQVSRALKTVRENWVNLDSLIMQLHDVKVATNQLSSGIASDYAAKQNAVAAAEANLQNAQSSLTSGLNSQLSGLNESLYDAQQALADAEAALGAQEQIKSMRRALEDMILSLDETREDDSTQQAISNLGIEARQKEIEEQQELIEKLEKKSVGAEIVAQTDGVISQINCVAGQTVSPDSALAEIQLAEKGFSMSIPVTVEQSRRVSVGDTADILYFWDGYVEAVLSKIDSDPSNPGQGRLLIFTLTGDVTVGQSLTVSVGQKSANYDTIVPNSSIHEDNNGKFILVVESKPGPLGNRYIATRLDVEVVASDETSSAVLGSMYGSEFVITSSSKPLTPGMQVKLVES